MVIENKMGMFSLICQGRALTKTLRGVGDVPYLIGSSYRSRYIWKFIKVNFYRLINFIVSTLYYINLYTLAHQKRKNIYYQKALNLCVFPGGKVNYKRFPNKILILLPKELISIYSTTILVSEFIVTFLFPFGGFFLPRGLTCKD